MKIKLGKNNLPTSEKSHINILSNQENDKNWAYPLSAVSDSVNIYHIGIPT